MVDPITLTGLALAGLAGGATAAATSGGGGGAPSPAAPPPQAAPQRAPQPKQQTGQASTFIGGVPAPPPSTGQKTLLGQ